jgi:hypothetical protein
VSVVTLTLLCGVALFTGDALLGALPAGDLLIEGGTITAGFTLTHVSSRGSPAFI